jgi:hypothetical protein
MKVILLLFTVFTAVHSQEQEDPCTVGDGNIEVGIDVSQKCCSETVLLQDENDFQLQNEVNECLQEMMSQMENNTEAFCTSTNCTLDYRDFQCVEDVKSLCKSLGGDVYEMDLEMRCPNGYGGAITFLRKNRVECLAPQCTEEEVLRFYDARAELQGCSIIRKSNLQKSVGSYSVEGDDDDSDHLGLTIAGIVAVIALFSLIAFTSM